MTKWPVRDGSPFDDGGEAFLNACIAELTSESRELTDKYGSLYAYDCVCAVAVPFDMADIHVQFCDKLADFVRGAE